MQINSGSAAAARFVYRPENSFASNNSLSLNKAASPGGDSFNLSKMGGRLCIQGQAVTEWDEPLTKATDEKTLKLIDESLSQVGSILEAMKKVAVMAEDETLSDVDRVDLQIEMTRLQERLSVETRRMSMRIAGQTEEEIAKNLSEINDTRNHQIEMLSRAKERILNGEQWDAREAVEYNFELLEVTVIGPQGREVLPASQDGGFVLPEHYNPADVVILKNYQPNGDRMAVTDDDSVPSLREILEGQNSLIVMDVESAKAARQKIEAQLDDLVKMREEFAEMLPERRQEVAVQRGEAASRTSMSDGELDAMLGQITRERIEKEQRELENARAAEEQAAAGRDENMAEGAAKVGEYLDEDGNYRKRVLVGTDVGTVAYEVDPQTGKPDMTSPRLIEADDKAGSFFMKLEKLFKDRIGRLLGFASKTPAQIAKAMPMTLSYSDQANDGLTVTQSVGPSSTKASVDSRLNTVLSSLSSADGVVKTASGFTP